MAKANKVFRRVGVEDFFIEVDKEKDLPNYIKIYDVNGKELTTVSTFTVGYEDEDGNECHSDGEYLN